MYMVKRENEMPPGFCFFSELFRFLFPAGNRGAKKVGRRLVVIGSSFLGRPWPSFVILYDEGGGYYTRVPALYDEGGV